MIGGSLMADVEFEFLLNQIPFKGLMIEVGTYHGVTARKICDRRPDVRVISIDSFNTNDGCRGNIDYYEKNMCARQTLFIGTLQEYLKKNIAIASLIFIDASHTMEDTLQDLESAMTLKDCIITGHDLLPGREVNDAVNKFCLMYGYKVILCKSLYRLIKL